MTTGHIDPVSVIERNSFSVPWSSAAFYELLENPSAAFFCAIDTDSSVSGYAGLFLVPGDGVFAGSAEIMNIAVRHDRRRCGIAVNLMRRLEEYASAHGAETLMLEVRVSNEAARELYRLFGFSEVGVRRNYYRHPTENAILMNKKISDRSEERDR
jgi:ribosomal-protein-alanine N-acetyltransferase